MFGFLASPDERAAPASPWIGWTRIIHEARTGGLHVPGRPYRFVEIWFILICYEKKYYYFAKKYCSRNKSV
jgi:hypothetical protein